MAIYYQIEVKSLDCLVVVLVILFINLFVFHEWEGVLDSRVFLLNVINLQVVQRVGNVLAAFMLVRPHQVLLQILVVEALSCCQIGSESTVLLLST